MKSKRPVTKSASADHKDAEEFARPTKTPSRKTPAQVKAESAARKAKVQVVLFQKASYLRQLTPILTEILNLFISL